MGEGKQTSPKYSLCAKCWHFEVRVIAAAIVFHVAAQFWPFLAAAAAATATTTTVPFTKPASPRKMAMAMMGCC